MLHLKVVAFFIGFVPLALEALTIRALAPISGTSILSTTVVLAIVVLALSLGYWRAAVANASTAESESRFAAAAAGFLLVSPLARFVLDEVNVYFSVSGFVAFRIVSLATIGAAILAGPASFFLGRLSPFVTQAIWHRVNDVKVAAGTSYLFSGVGGLVGSICGSLIFVPSIGVSKSYVALALICFVVFVVLRRGFPVAPRAIIFGFVLGGAVLCIGDSVVTAGRGALLHREDSLYQTLFVREWEDKQLGKMRGLFFDQGLAMQSMMIPSPIQMAKVFFDDPLPLGEIAFKRLSPGVVPRVLILGSAGGTLGSLLSRYYGAARPRVFDVDLDIAVHRIAEKFFNVGPDVAVPIAADARYFVENSLETYHFIYVDLFSRGLFTPSEVLTLEFVEALARRLEPSGVVGFNLAVRSVNSELAQTVLGNFQRFFSFVYVTPQAGPRGQGLSNYLLSASRVALPLLGGGFRSPSVDLDETFRHFKNSTVRAPQSKCVGSDDSTLSEWLTLKMLLGA